MDGNDRDLGTSGLDGKWFRRTGVLADSVTLTARGWFVLLISVFVVAGTIALARGSSEAVETCIALAIVTALGYLVHRAMQRWSPRR